MKERYSNYFLLSENKNNVGFAISDGKSFLPIFLLCLSKIGVKTITLFDLDIESETKHKVLNDQINELSTVTIPFKNRIEDYFSITKDMGLGKYRGLAIFINKLYLEQNEELIELLKKIDASI